MIKINKIFFFEIGLIFLLWLASLWMSHEYFNRPLGVHHEWITAHVLISMRAYNEWGFWKLMGASVFLPHTKEWATVDIVRKGVEINKTLPAVYLSYPSWYIVFPYMIWKLMNLIPFIRMPLSALFLESFNLVISRLFTGIIVFYLFFETIKIFLPEKSELDLKRALAFIGVAAWMFNPAVLYFTQNIYFAENSYLGFIYAMTLMSVKCGFKLEKLSRGNKCLLFIFTFIACGTSYYGWLVLAVIWLIVLISRLISLKPFAMNTYLKTCVSAIYPTAAGAFIAGATFIAQLSYYKGGFGLLISKFIWRAGFGSAVFEPWLSRDTPAVMFSKILSYWDNLLPFGMYYRHEFYFSAAFLALSVIVSLTLAAKAKDKMSAFSIILLIYAVPVSYLFLLKEWSSFHDFSALIMSLPVIFSWAVLPVLLARSFRAANYALLMVALLVIITASQSKCLSVQFADKGSNIYQLLGGGIAKNARDNDIMIVLPPHLLPKGNQDLSYKTPNRTFILYFPPFLWYADRYVYRIATLHTLVSSRIFKSSKINKLNIVFVAFNPNERLDEKLSDKVRKKGGEIKEKLDGQFLYLYRISK